MQPEKRSRYSYLYKVGVHNSSANLTKPTHTARSDSTVVDLIRIGRCELASKTAVADWNWRTSVGSATRTCPRRDAKSIEATGEELGALEGTAHTIWKAVGQSPGRGRGSSDSSVDDKTALHSIHQQPTTISSSADVPSSPSLVSGQLGTRRRRDRPRRLRTVCSVQVKKSFNSTGPFSA